MPLVSVIMPVYNAKSDELKTSIESILNQTLKDFEFIIINDGSDNDSEDVILSYTDERIRYVKNDENLKIIKTLNRGLELAQGKYIARLDSDDYSAPERLEKQASYLDKTPSVGVLGTYFCRIPQGTVVSIPSGRQDVKLFLRYCQNCIIHSSVMFRKSVLDRHDLKYDINCLHAEDHKLWSDMSEFCEIDILPEVLTFYRHSDDSVSARNRAYQAKMVTIIILDNIIKDFAEDKDYMYSILVKYIKGSPVSEKEFNDMGYLLGGAVNYIQERISPPFDCKVKNYILSVLKYFIISDSV